jgi:hypothetical protein
MEFLPDPLNDRPVKELPPFINNYISDDILFKKNAAGQEIPDWKMFEEFMSKEGPMQKA